MQPDPWNNPQQGGGGYAPQQTQPQFQDPNAQGFAPQQMQQQMGFQPQPGQQMGGFGGQQMGMAPMMQPPSSGKGAKIALFTVLGLLVAGGATVGIMYAVGFFDDPEFVGKWYEGDGSETEIQSDGDILSDDMDDGESMKWSDDDEDSFKVKMEFEDISMTGQYKYDLKGDVLFLYIDEVDYDGETIENPNEGRCTALVKASVADTYSEWEDAVDSVRWPSYCDEISYYGDM